jgi:hypothetical protein
VQRFQYDTWSNDGWQCIAIMQTTDGIWRVRIRKGETETVEEFTDQHEAMRRFASLVMAAPSTNQAPLP